MEEEVHISSDTSREIILTFFWSYATHALDLAGKDKEYSSIHLTETWMVRCILWKARMQNGENSLGPSGPGRTSDSN